MARLQFRIGGEYLNERCAGTLCATRRLSAASLATAVAATSTTVAATATTAAVATTTTAAAITAATSATTTAATWRPSFARASFIHRQRPAFNGLAVEFRDRLLCIGVRGHGYKGKSTRFTRELVLHERDFLNGSGLGEKILQIRLGCVEGKISYV
jgi:hypothetical protein